MFFNDTNFSFHVNKNRSNYFVSIWFLEYIVETVRGWNTLYVIF